MKRIVLCADGTWNLRDQVDVASGKRRPTNVTKVARAILPRNANGIDQVVYYHDGLGTGGPLDRITGGAFGRGIEQTIRELYRFVVYNYDDGDELYFFGFSRGAFTVRSLAGFMSFVGLVQKQDDFFVPDLYACYESGRGPGTPEWTKAFRHITNPRPCPPIRFIGVWDTVGALGAPGVLGQVFNPRKYAYHDVELHATVQTAVHALALEERRKPFRPTLWKRPSGWLGNLVQAWFPGVHCNVGGGYDPDGLANEALHFIVEHAEKSGLAMNSPYLNHFKPCFNSVLNDSMSAKYRVMGPYVRPVGDQTADGEVIHQSALDRMAYKPSDYQPANLKRYIQAAGKPATTTTTRIARGVPC